MERALRFKLRRQAKRAQRREVGKALHAVALVKRPRRTTHAV